ncbi:MAG TPA: sulfotransferase [Chromatiales bacterium]|nr:sulfotransferase [Chromatiales bacterium]
MRGAYEKPGEIEQILASHSRIYGAGELTWINKLVLPLLTKYAVARNNGENLLFSQTDIRAIPETYSNQLSELTIGEEIVTDKMPLNFMWIGVILSVFSDAKIINFRRDPIATC